MAKNKGGRPFKGVPPEALEHIYERRYHSRERGKIISKTAAIDEVISNKRFKGLDEKARSRIEKAYRPFEDERQWMSPREVSLAKELDRLKEEEERKRSRPSPQELLEQAEATAREELGTDDLSEDSLSRFIAEVERIEAIHQRIHKPPEGKSRASILRTQAENMLRELGPVETSDAIEKLRQLKSEYGAAKKLAGWAERVMKLREAVREEEKRESESG